MMEPKSQETTTVNLQRVEINNAVVLALAVWKKKKPFFKQTYFRNVGLMVYNIPQGL